MKIYNIPLIGQFIDKSEVELLQTQLEFANNTINIQLNEISNLQNQLSQSIQANCKLLQLDSINLEQHNKIIQFSKINQTNFWISWTIQSTLIISTALLTFAIWNGY